MKNTSNYDRAVKIVFIVAFSVLLLLPIVRINFHDGQISDSENRRLADMASLFDEQGNINPSFTHDFELWINDNIGLRSLMVRANTQIQYRVFHRLEDSPDMYLGPNGELNYITNAIMRDYQRNNKYDDEYLRSYALAMQELSDYAQQNGALFYYYQCWDKHSIYPEYFPLSVIPGSGDSRTDEMVLALQRYTDVNVVSPKIDLINAKVDYNVFSVWGDPTHWSNRGAYIGYLDLMDAINRDSDIQYRVLSEDNYDLSLHDYGYTVAGCVHETDYEEAFILLTPEAVLNNDLLTLYREDERNIYYVNPFADNSTRLLIIGDSYFGSFIIDDLAESFNETILIWGDYLPNYSSIIDEYQPDIVVVEVAERVDRTMTIIQAATVDEEEG